MKTEALKPGLDIKAKSAVRAVAVFIVISVTFGALYYVLAAWNPALSKSVAGPFAMTFRLSHLLRAFTLWLGPAVPFGTFLGSQAFNGSLGMPSFVPIVNLAICLGIAAVSRFWGRSYLKDIVLLLLYAVLTGLVVSLKLTTIALVLDPASWQPLLTSAILLKIATHSLVYMAGYPILLVAEKVFAHVSESRSIK